MSSEALTVKIPWLNDYYFVAVKTEYQRELSSNSRYDISFTLLLRTSQLLSLVLSFLNCEMR